MMTIFTTQLLGRLKTIAQEDELLEDAARLLCQSLIGEGNLFIDAYGEMGVLAEALYGQDRLERVNPLSLDGSFAEIDHVDRALLVARTSHHPKLMEAATFLHTRHVPFVVIVAKHEANDLDTLADFIIDLNCLEGLVPDETGKRVGHPTSIAALYCFISLQLMIKEMLEDYQ
ncbi:DUF2529 family protein [Bacillus sp. JCM 19034]|uniref:DUF2529 family protein n=1 Tax=Bacillus sp. JCM 19034 TaxID=1481928 RepID=UPI000782C088|nr:DUF2529 family protein [Bacillus sp. JCM 19034]